MKLVRISENIYEENCYILSVEKDCYIIDPGFNYDKICEYIELNHLYPKAIFLTHGHIDHTGDIDKLSITYKDILVFISEYDSALLFDSDYNCSSGFGKSKVYKDNMNFKFYDYKTNFDSFKFYEAPGHTKGGVLIEYGDYLFTGDTLFKGTVGRSDLPTGNINELSNSLKFIRNSFSKSKIILPGHYNKTTLKDEISDNPFMKR